MDFDASSSYKELMGQPQDVLDHPDRNLEEMHDLVRGMTYKADEDRTDVYVPRGDGGHDMKERIRINKK